METKYPVQIQMEIFHLIQMEQEQLMLTMLE